MQKHQQWIDNRSYEQHLDCLKKIKARRNCSPNLRKKCRKNILSSHSTREHHNKENRSSSPHQIYQSRQISNEEHFKTQEYIQKKFSYKNYDKNKLAENGREKLNFLFNQNPFSMTQNFFHRPKKLSNPIKNETKDSVNVSLKEQEILWNNFLLGKRILQTNPVICKKKQDLDYQKHKQLVRSMTGKKSQENSNFRLRKLQQHNDKIYKISDDHRIENNLHKQFMVNLVIQSIEFFKYKFSSFENIILFMKSGHIQSEESSSIEGKKKTKQVSQCISSSLLTAYNFFFTFKKKKFQHNVPIVIEIKNVKSLNVISIGTFSFQFDGRQEVLMKQASLFNFGKHIGTVKFNAHFGKKNDFLSHIQ